MEMPDIYVIVYVSYDHYRFQENMGATTEMEDARSIAKKALVEQGEMPIIECGIESLECDSTERRHIWIEKWDQSRGS